MYSQPTQLKLHIQRWNPSCTSQIRCFESLTDYVVRKVFSFVNFCRWVEYRLSRVSVASSRSRQLVFLCGIDAVVRLHVLSVMISRLPKACQRKQKQELLILIGEKKKSMATTFERNHRRIDGRWKSWKHSRKRTKWQAKSPRFSFSLWSITFGKHKYDRAEKKFDRSRRSQYLFLIEFKDEVLLFIDRLHNIQHRQQTHSAQSDSSRFYRDENRNKKSHDGVALNFFWMEICMRLLLHSIQYSERRGRTETESRHTRAWENLNEHKNLYSIYNCCCSRSVRSLLSAVLDASKMFSSTSFNAHILMIPMSFAIGAKVKLII